MMTASVYQPISSVLKTSFHGHGAGGAKNSSLNSKMDSTLQKSMLVAVHFDDPVKQSPTLTPKQKSKYTILNPKSETNDVAHTTWQEYALHQAGPGARAQGDFFQEGAGGGGVQVPLWARGWDVQHGQHMLS